jgi:hypothetical protein
MKRTLMGLVASIALLAGSTAFALDVNGTTGADTIVIGYDSTGNDIIACVNSTATMVTENSSTLSVNVVVNADEGADTIKVLGSGDSSESVCSRTLTGSFSPNGKFIDVNGEEGNDIVRGGLLDGNLHGNDGNDQLRLRAKAGVFRSTAFGDLGDDHLCATDVTGEDMKLDGADGADVYEATAGGTGDTITYVLGSGDGDADIYDNDTPFQFESTSGAGGEDSGTADPSSTCLSI